MLTIKRTWSKKPCEVSALDGELTNCALLKYGPDEVDKSNCILQLDSKLLTIPSLSISISRLLLTPSLSESPGHSLTGISDEIILSHGVMPSASKIIPQADKPESSDTPLGGLLHPNFICSSRD